jgi:hypothetical protein
MKMIVEYPGSPKIELGLKDSYGKNAMDIAE